MVKFWSKNFPLKIWENPEIRKDGQISINPRESVEIRTIPNPDRNFQDGTREEK